jgi:D-galactarolactone isomerase
MDQQKNGEAALSGSRGGKPRLKAPPGTTDTHMHFYDTRVPFAHGAAITHGDALVPEYLKVRERLGIERTVIVQAAGYGYDNTVTLDAMKQLGDSARAIVVVEPSVADAELERLTKLGSRGVRYFMLGGFLHWESLEELAARTANFGWHVQLQLDGRDLPERLALIQKVKGTLVIDHTGKFLEPVKTDHPAFRVLLDLVDNGRTWVKLSAPYETSKAGPPYYCDVGALAKELVKRAPERMLWASNWPHPTAGSNKPDDAMLLDVLLDWIPDEATRKKVLVDNPAKLYGF